MREFLQLQVEVETNIEGHSGQAVRSREIWFGENDFLPTSAELCIGTNTIGQNHNDESANHQGGRKSFHFLPRRG